MPPKIIAISYAKRALDPASRERARLRAYADALDQYHVIVFTRSSEAYPAVQYDGPLTLYVTNSTKRLAMLARAFKIGKHILENQPDAQFIVSSQDPFESSLVGRMLTYNTPHQHHVQIHGDVFNPQSYRSSLLQRVRAWYGRRVVRRTEIIRVVSERIKRSLERLGVASERIVVLPIQPTLDAFLQVGKARVYEDCETLRLLYVGRLASEKNVSLLLKAVAELKAQQKNFSLRIVGAGPEQARLQDQQADLGLSDEVTFVDWSEDIPSEMAAADVLCVTSNHEGWGMVLQEAAASGLSIVTTDVGCAGEFISQDEAGLVVPVGDQAAFTAALSSLFETSTRERLGRAAYAKAVASAVSEREYIKRWVASHTRNE